MKTKLLDDENELMLPFNMDLESFSITTVPYVCNNYIVRLDSEIGEPKNFRKLFDLLKVATENDIISLIINSNGGWFTTATQLIYDLQNTKAHTIAEVHHAYSAAACFALACKEIVVTDFSSMMIHSLSYGIEGKLSDITNQNNFIQKQNEDMLKKLFTGFLTKDEISSVLKGQDMWLYSNDILARLEKMAVANSGKQKGKKKNETV